jgi:hypothetical protein
MRGGFQDFSQSERGAAFFKMAVLLIHGVNQRIADKPRADPMFYHSQWRCDILACMVSHLYSQVRQIAFDGS